jgi:hypothetical protein
MTLPAELQVGRRARAPSGTVTTATGRDGWLLQTGSGLQAGYGKAPLRRGFSMPSRGQDAGR